MWIYIHTVAARYFAHLSVVSSRQRSNDVLWLRGRVIILLLIALLWTWMSCMKVTLKGFGFVKSIEVDGGALMKAGIVTYVLAQMGTSTGAYGVRSRTTA